MPEEEYTDYSCSTSIERLARDVETILRAWHVDRGSDRHVSIAPLQSQITTNHESTSSNSMVDDSPTSHLIRANTIQWNIAVTTPTEGRTSVVVDLELALWDAPDAIVAADEDDKQHGEHEPLVRSLRRKPFTNMPSHVFWFDNFSTLFGIGQHISLSPIQPDPIPPALVESLAVSLLLRHDDQRTAPWVLGSTLSGWLQNALNCAVTNCKCCIPAFGLWGLYRPDQLLPNEESISVSSSSSSSIWPSSRSALSPRSKTVKELHGSFSDDNPLLGTTINSKSSPVTRTGVQVFPNWVRVIKTVPLPSVTRKYKSLCQRQWNAKFVPPVVAGTVVVPSTLDTPTTSATFWCSATPQARNTVNIATNSRLAVWASVLLHHCPDTTVVLSGARHVFGWFKPLKKVRRLSLLFSSYDEEQQQLAQMQEWRNLHRDEHDTDMGLTEDDIELYRQTCRTVALELLEEAWTYNHNNHYRQRSKLPVWGPVDDPVASVYATTTWHGKTSNSIDHADAQENGASHHDHQYQYQYKHQYQYPHQQHNGTTIVEPLMQFPLRIRSRQELSHRDWIDMEESVERTILNPLQPSKFCIQAYYDRETSVATLAANQRCILAALIRAATLPGETLLQHLTEEALVGMWDNNAGTIVACKLADRSKVGSATKSIVEAMDWANIMDEMINLRDAEEVVHHVMDGSLTLVFPNSPEDAFSERDIYSPFRKTAPFGRLLSILFAHMAKLRSLSSMALVWSVFIQELRRRWELRESLPNMQYIPGLDPHPLDLYEKRCYSTIGLKANFAAFLHCSEPDPDDYHCLIGQKLQVFNLGVESLVASEIAEHEALERFLGAGQVPSSAPQKTYGDSGGEVLRRTSITTVETMISTTEGDEVMTSPSTGKRKWPKAKEKVSARSSFGEDSLRRNYGPPTINTDLEFWVMDEPGHTHNLDQGLDFASPPTDDAGFDFIAPPPTNLDDLEIDIKFVNGGSKSNGNSNKKIIVEGLPDAKGAWEGTIMDGSDGGSVATSCSLSQPYFDAAEAGSIFSIKNGFISFDTVVNVADMQRRPGARCPVHGATYGPNREQLYAPYLQRPYPLTDDVVLERRFILTHSPEVRKKGDVQYRIELAHRLQKPKLLSDMQAFKAANPNATFDDFIKWYGNPGSPLDDYNEEQFHDDLSIQDAYQESAAKKLDKASEAMKVLMATREFWSSTWEDAKPIPASEQKPLFDVSSVVEMTLDYLEQMHPANLVNQIMGVNLSAAYFTLVTSAEDTLKIGIVQTSFARLRTKIDKALQLLSRDATGLSVQLPDTGSVGENSTTSQRYAAEDTLYACEEACNALSETETMIARAMSLLRKFPNQNDLIQALLMLADGTPVPLDDPLGRSSFLSAIHKQQQQHSNFATYDSLPKPVLREYVLRNIDDSIPCQLSVRFGDEGAYLDRVESEGGVLLALSKSYKD